VDDGDAGHGSESSREGKTPAFLHNAFDRPSPHPDMNCAFAGAGTVAREYADGLDDTGLRLAAVCDLDADRAAALASDHDAAAYGDLSALLDAEDAPLVVNLTSHAAHADVTRTALDAGRHVYSQKPLALDPATARDLVALADDRDRALACAPDNATAPAQRRAATALADGRLGDVGLAYAHAHVGRVYEWHDDPDSFLRVGPLYDGAVYPLTLLVSWFGPVERVRTADADSPWPERVDRRPDGPSHVEATLSFADGPLVRLIASLYAPHRAREFNSLELHGDDGSLYLTDCGAMTDATATVRFAREGRSYVAHPPQSSSGATTFADGPARLARAVADGRRPRRSARRAAHVVAVADAVERAADSGDPVEIDQFGGWALPSRTTDWRPEPAPDAAIRLPRIGFGCSRYRDGEYVDRADSVVAALDAGYRLFDSAELYGNEGTVGDALAAPGAPDRRAVHVTSKVWNTNHGHVREACETTLDALGLDTLDSYLVHWPDAWAYRGPLRGLASLPPDEAEALTFPRDDDGEIREADVSLAETWRAMERLVDDGLTRTIGLCNVSVEELDGLLESARIRPAVVQVERNPYEPRSALVDYCHERGVRVVAHTPFSTRDLLAEPTVRAVADEEGVTPAQAVLAWNVADGVVPIPSSTDESHIVENLAAGAVDLSADSRARLDAVSAGGEGA
jgi:alcohol dehydrogenase (NADP+)